MHARRQYHISVSGILHATNPSDSEVSPLFAILQATKALKPNCFSGPDIIQHRSLKTGGRQGAAVAVRAKGFRV